MENKEASSQARPFSVGDLVVVNNMSNPMYYASTGSEPGLCRLVSTLDQLNNPPQTYAFAVSHCRLATDKEKHDFLLKNKMEELRQKDEKMRQQLLREQAEKHLKFDAIWAAEGKDIAPLKSPQEAVMDKIDKGTVPLGHALSPKEKEMLEKMRATPDNNFIVQEEDEPSKKKEIPNHFAHGEIVKWQDLFFYYDRSSNIVGPGYCLLYSRREDLGTGNYPQSWVPQRDLTRPTAQERDAFQAAETKRLASVSKGLIGGTLKCGEVFMIDGSKGIRPLTDQERRDFENRKIKSAASLCLGDVVEFRGSLYFYARTNTPNRDGTANIKVHPHLFNLLDGFRAEYCNIEDVYYPTPEKRNAFLIEEAKHCEKETQRRDKVKALIADLAIKQGATSPRGGEEEREKEHAFHLNDVVKFGDSLFFYGPSPIPGYGRIYKHLFDMHDHQSVKWAQVEIQYLSVPAPQEANTFLLAEREYVEKDLAHTLNVQHKEDYLADKEALLEAVRANDKQMILQNMDPNMKRRLLIDYVWNEIPNSHLKKELDNEEDLLKDKYKKALMEAIHVKSIQKVEGSIAKSSEKDEDTDDDDDMPPLVPCTPPPEPETTSPNTTKVPMVQVRPDWRMGSAIMRVPQPGEQGIWMERDNVVQPPRMARKLNWDRILKHVEDGHVRTKQKTKKIILEDFLDLFVDGDHKVEWEWTDELQSFLVFHRVSYAAVLEQCKQEVINMPLSMSKEVLACYRAQGLLLEMFPPRSDQKHGQYPRFQRKWDKKKGRFENEDTVKPCWFLYDDE